MKQRTEITQEKVKELFEYRDGCLYRYKQAGRKPHGERAGAVGTTGYIYIMINGIIYLEHRMIFILFHGFLPKSIDHINGVRTDNRIENLREATQSENMCNAVIRSDNTSGIKGVYFDKKRKKWTGQLCLYGKRICLGRYDSIELAQTAMRESREKYHNRFANHG